MPMHSELTNLLPLERITANRREYFTRLATVVVSTLSCVVLASGVLLVPSYLFLHQEMQSREARISELNIQLAAAGGEAATKRLSVLSANAGYLARLASTPTATAAINAVLAVPHAGISLSSLTFTPPTQGPSGRMTLTGVASTREALRSYALALDALPFVSSTDLPISVYAKESNIPFAITLTGTLQP